jgi:hypothetical protein
VEKTNRVLEMAVVGRRRHGERGRRTAALGRDGDAGRRPTCGRREEHRAGTVERYQGTMAESLLERISEREASGENEWTRGCNARLLGWCHGPRTATSRPSDDHWARLFCTRIRIGYQTTSLKRTRLVLHISSIPKKSLPPASAPPHSKKIP